MASALDTRVQTRIRDAIQTKFTNTLSWEVSQVQTNPVAAYDVAAGTVDEGTVTDYTVRCSPRFGVERRFVSSTVEDSDSQVVVPALGLAFVPSVGQTVTVGGTEEWTVLMVEDYHADTEPAAYAVILRR